MKGKAFRHPTANGSPARGKWVFSGKAQDRTMNPLSRLETADGPSLVIVDVKNRV